MDLVKIIEICSVIRDAHDTKSKELKDKANQFESDGLVEDAVENLEESMRELSAALAVNEVIGEIIAKVED